MARRRPSARAPVSFRDRLRAVRRRFARMPLRWRLALWTFGLLAVLLAGLGALVSLTEEHELLRNQAVALYDEAHALDPLHAGRILVGKSGQPLPTMSQTPPSLSGLAPSIANRLTGFYVTATVLDTSGDVLASGASAQPDDLQPALPSADAIRRALTEPFSPGTYYLATGPDGRRQLYVLWPLDQGNYTVGLLQLSTRTTTVDRAVAFTQFILFTGIAGALLLAAALALPLMSAALRPLREMERASRAIAQGALSLRLKEPGTDDEIGRLAHSFNAMVAQLDDALERQKRFVSDVSHELRTPLTALGGGLEMLLLGADAGDPEAQRRLVRGMYAETERMRRLVEDLLTLTRLDEGRLPFRLAAVDPAALLRDVAEQAKLLAEGQRIATELTPGLPPLRADADRLREVLLNLVENALKHTPADGAITLAARPGPQRGSVALDVRDTGVGIPPEALPHVFDRFYRADYARARAPQQKGGSGLGLAIARSLIEAQGGTIAIASEPGRGTTVTVTLPAARQDEAPTQPDTPGVSNAVTQPLGSAGASAETTSGAAPAS